MKIAILGYNGFIGNHLLAFLSKSYEVVGVSLHDSEWKEKVIDCDIIINLVGKAHDHKGKAFKEDYYYANFQLAKDIFENYISTRSKLLIHISSLAASEEFKSDDALSEERECNPESLYGKSKRKAEKWLMNQKLPLGKKLIIFRPPMVHGPGDKGNLALLYKFISKGIPYPLAAFDNRRSFISIYNFCFIIERTISYVNLVESGLYHIADDESISTKEIIGIIKDVTGKKHIDLTLPKNLIRLLAKVGDLIPIYLNSSKLKKMTSTLIVSNKKIKNALHLFGDLPTTAKEGIEETIRSLNR